MRAPRIILAVVIGAILLFGFGILRFALTSPYLRFMGKDASYFAEVAHGCDLVLRQHPVSSNDTAVVYGESLPYRAKLSGHEPSLPKIIRALHPDMIVVSTNRVAIEIPPNHMGGFVVTWEPDDMRTNLWVLQSNGDGLIKTVYEERRP